MTSRKRRFGVCRWCWVFPTLLAWHGIVFPGVLAPVPARAADETQNNPGRCWAVLIAVEKYQYADSLVFTLNDVKEIGRTLRQWGGYSDQYILEITDEQPNPALQPLKGPVTKALGDFLAKIEPQDRVIVYFSGHGFRAEDGSLYLALADCKPDQAAQTGLPVGWLRQQLEACQAGQKFLILDACHAGAEKGPHTLPHVDGKALASAFDNLIGVYTLASCTGAEQSVLWQEMKQSLFSYWLNQGLKGHADANGDARVSVDELYNYVYDRVLTASKVVFGKPQTPVRSIPTTVQGVPEIIRLKPSTLKATLNEMADELSTAIRMSPFSSVAVVEFKDSTQDPRLAELLGGDLGLLGRNCAEELERRLRNNLEQRGSQFQVLSHATIQKTLSKDRYIPDDLKTAAIKGLKVDGKDVQSLVVGKFEVRERHLITLRCTLLGTVDQQDCGMAGGTAMLNERDWAMRGRSAVLPQEEHPTPPPDTPPLAEAQETIAAWELASQQPHPLADKDFPYRVRITVGGRERKGHFKGNEMYVPLESGETYEIWVENRTDDPVFMRLLVDGLNTLPQRASEKAIVVKPVYLPAQRVSLDDARAWWLGARPAGKAAALYAVRGFFKEIGRFDRYNSFTVVDVPESEAARQGFTEQIGVISAAFYEPISKDATRGDGPDVGTGRGAEGRDRVDEYQGDKVPGTQRAVIHIRYLSRRGLQDILAQRQTSE